MPWLPPNRPKFELLKNSFKLASLLFLSFSLAPNCAAQETSQNVLQVYLNEGRKVPVEDAVRAVVFDESVCATRISAGSLEVIGLKRGESVVFVWYRSDARTAYLVRVVPRPQLATAPTLRKESDPMMGSGEISSAVQSISGGGMPSGLVLFHRLDWEQGAADGHLSIRAQGQDSTLTGSPLFNLNTATIQYQTPHVVLTLLDSSFNLNGGPTAQVVPSVQYGGLVFRGADLMFRRGKSDVEFFAGSSLPPYFLVSTGTKDIAGINTVFAFGDKFSLFTTSAATSIPVINSSTSTVRKLDFFQTVGISTRPGRDWAMEADGGVSESGIHAQAGAAYSRFGQSTYWSAAYSSPNFVLNQLQILSSGTLSFNAGSSQSFGRRITASIAYQHMSSQPSLLFNTTSTTDYLTPGLSVLVTQRNHLALNYSISRNDSPLASSQSLSHRGQVTLSSQLSTRLNNTLAASYGAVADPLQLDAQSQLSLRDSLDFRVKQHTFNLSVSHDRVDPSLINRINQQIQLLPDSLRNLFLFDPVGFVAAGNLSPQLRSLLQGVQPSNTQASLTAQFLIGHAINFSPTVGYFHQDQGLATKSNSQTFGYTLNWQLVQSLSLQSSLSNAFLWDSSVNALRRTTVLSVGLTKSFNGAPTLGFHHRTEPLSIQGIVFRDSTVSGTYKRADAGIPNVLVHLDDGSSTVTDANGRFEFRNLERHTYQVTMELAQFRNPVRLTTPVALSAFPGSGSAVAFGIVDFSRVTGTLFNDYLLNTKMQPDAAGVKEVELTLNGHGQSWKTKTDSAGEFEIDNIPAGTYELTINRATLPPDYVIPATSYPIQVGATSTVVQDVPIRALRSIAGRVAFQLKTNPSDSGERSKSALKLQAAPPQPLKNVKLAIGGQSVTTDADGNFIFRELPGGPLLLTVVPANAPPDSVKLPSWPITLPHDAFKAEGVNITISNPDLLAYLLTKDALPPVLQNQRSAVRRPLQPSNENHEQAAGAGARHKATSFSRMSRSTKAHVDQRKEPSGKASTFACRLSGDPGDGSQLMLCSDQPESK